MAASAGGCRVRRYGVGGRGGGGGGGGGSHPCPCECVGVRRPEATGRGVPLEVGDMRSEEHTSELQSRPHLVCRLLLEKKKIVPLPIAVRSRMNIPRVGFAVDAFAGFVD